MQLRSKVVLFLLMCLVGLALPSLTPILAQDETDDARLYWSRGSSIFRGMMDGSDPETVISGLPLRYPVFSANGLQMYGIGLDGVIRRANADGSGLTVLLAAANNPRSLIIDNDGGKLYWADDTSIRRANLDGSNQEAIVTGEDDPIALHADFEQGKLFWQDDLETIRSANLNGSSPATIYTVPAEGNRILCLRVDPVDGKVYWQLGESFLNGPVMRANGDGSNVETLPLEDICPTINVEKRRLYWVQVAPSPARIMRSNLDGTGVQQVVSGVSSANMLNFDNDNNYLYWYEATLMDPSIKRVPLDGGAAQTIVAMYSNPSGLTINHAQGTIYWGLNGSIERARLDGSDRTETITAAFAPSTLALDLDGARIYWRDSGDLRVVNTDGSNASIFWTTEGQPIRSAIRYGPVVDSDAGKVRWIASLSNVEGASGDDSQGAPPVLHLFSANLDGAGVTQLPLSLIAPYAIDVENGHFFGFKIPEGNSGGDRELTRMNFDGTGATGLGIFNEMFGDIDLVAVDGVGGKIYWSKDVGWLINQANLDGSEQALFDDEVEGPNILVVDPVDEMLYWSFDRDGNTITERTSLDGSGRTTLFDFTSRGLAFDHEGAATPTNPAGGAVHLPMILKK